MEILTLACTTILSVAAVLALAWKVILPWLREQITHPLAETREHVANTHTTNLRDDIDKVIGGLESLTWTVDAHITESKQRERRLELVEDHLLQQVARLRR